MKAGRPIGRRVLECCSAVDHLGGHATARQVEFSTSAGLSNTHKYLNRALHYGMVTRHGDVYYTITGWQSIAAQYRDRQRDEEVLYHWTTSIAHDPFRLCA